MGKADQSPSSDSSTALEVRAICLNLLKTLPNCAADALESLLIVPRDPFERPSAPTPNRASRRYTTTSPDPQPMDLDNATVEEKQMMAAYLARLRVSSFRSFQITPSNRAFEQGSAPPQIKPEQGIKREGEATGAGGFRKKVKQEGATVVDLTLED
jgi:hypothetical protein